MYFEVQPGPVSGSHVHPAEAAALLRLARALLAAQPGESQLLAGKQLALLSTECDDAPAQAFIDAATALGARVSFVQPGLDDGSPTAQIDALARMLGELYDAVECQHLPAALVQRIASGAGIPVFTGLATAGHPTAALADTLDGDVLPQDKRRCVLQAALLISIG